MAQTPLTLGPNTPLLSAAMFHTRCASQTGFRDAPRPGGKQPFEGFRARERVAGKSAAWPLAHRAACRHDTWQVQFSGHAASTHRPARREEAIAEGKRQRRLPEITALSREGLRPRGPRSHLSPARPPWARPPQAGRGEGTAGRPDSFLGGAMRRDALRSPQRRPPPRPAEGCARCAAPAQAL